MMQKLKEEHDLKNQEHEAKLQEAEEEHKTNLNNVKTENEKALAQAQEEF